MIHRSLLLSLLCCGALLGGEGIKIVANPSVGLTEITGNDLRSIYLGNMTSVNHGRPVFPVLNRGQDNMARFASEYLGKSRTALETYYRSLVFTGRWSMPPSLAGDTEVVDFISRTPGAIGFIRETSPAGPLVTLKVTSGVR